MKVILNYGLGVESTTILHRWLTDTTTRDFDLSQLVVVTAQTGNEFPDTRRLVEDHVLPLLIEHGVRYVQLARNGPGRADGITVLSDTTWPTRLHTEGVWKLYDELIQAGTVPQVAARRCSEKFKGWVIDTWLEQEMKGNPFRQVMGFNADEGRRVERDSFYGGDNRRAEYPLMEWGWGREACEAYLLEAFGEPWSKSCCSFCPFAAGKPAIMERYRRMPEQAAEALFLEHVSMALNPRMTLYADKSLIDCLRADGNDQALHLFQLRLEQLPWALYRVRRLYASKGVASRSVEVLQEGTRQEVEDAIRRVYDEAEFTANSWRVWLVRREAGVYPTAEEMLVAAPASAKEKERTNFEQRWLAVAG